MNECVKNDYFKWESIFLITFVFGMFASIILHVLTIPLSVEHKYKKIEKEIVATKSDTRIDGSIEGSLFYVRGKVDEVDYYFVLSKNIEIYKQGNRKGCAYLPYRGIKSILESHLK